MHRFCSILPLLVLLASLSAETVSYVPGMTIDCPVPIAATDREITRVVTFPCVEISQIGIRQTEFLEAKKFRNRLVLRLTNPVFEQTVSVWDESNNLYVLTVRSPTENDLVDSEIILRKAGVGGAVGAGPGDGGPRVILHDTDQAVMDLMAEMQSGRLKAGTTYMNVTSVERGKPLQGRRLFADDNLEMRLVRVYRAQGLYGYETTVLWRGEQPMTLDIQRLKPRKGIATSASSQAVLTRLNPDFIAPSDRLIRVWYVCAE